ncbi:hypothetical protein [Winogradskyella sp.]|uniref:hypothetical protein n=1 Tax=Winogradskyella sp. TaxID=1883156 RepID=UPI002629AFE4|nr:hypothetical protein [Winogradskyella sp.]
MKKIEINNLNEITGGSDPSNLECMLLGGVSVGLFLVGGPVGWALGIASLAHGADRCW